VITFLSRRDTDSDRGEKKEPNGPTGSSGVSSGTTEGKKKGKRPTIHHDRRTKYYREGKKKDEGCPIRKWRSVGLVRREKKENTDPKHYLPTTGGKGKKALALSFISMIKNGLPGGEGGKKGNPKGPIHWKLDVVLSSGGKKKKKNQGRGLCGSYLSIMGSQGGRNCASICGCWSRRKKGKRRYEE